MNFKSTQANYCDSIYNHKRHYSNSLTFAITQLLGILTAQIIITQKVGSACSPVQHSNPVNGYTHAYR